MRTGEMILYQTEDGLTKISLRAIDGTVWLTQEEIADLFMKGRTTIIEHIQNILKEEELHSESVCRKFRHTAPDGKDYNVQHYNLDMILAVGTPCAFCKKVQNKMLWAVTGQTAAELLEIKSLAAS